MIRRARAAVASCVLALSASSCTGSPGPENASGEEVEFAVLDSTLTSDYPTQSPVVLVATEDEEWDALWAGHAGDAAEPAVDLSTSVVLAFFGGPGYGGVEITSVRVEENELVLDVARQDWSDCPHLSVVQTPAELITVARRDEEALPRKGSARTTLVPAC